MNKSTQIKTYIEQLAAGMPLGGAIKLASYKFNVGIYREPTHVDAVCATQDGRRLETSCTCLDVYLKTETGSWGEWLSSIIVRQKTDGYRRGRHG